MPNKGNGSDYYITFSSFFISFCKRVNFCPKCSADKKAQKQYNDRKRKKNPIQIEHKAIVDMLRNRGEDYNDFVTESYYYRDLIKGKKVSPCPNDYNSSIQTQKQYEEWLKQKHQELTKRPKKPPGTLICTGYFYMFHSVLSCVILTALSNRDPATGGGEHMEIVISFLVAVAAGVTCHLICKWLGSHNKDNE